jgi:hypothetical protein
MFRSIPLLLASLVGMLFAQSTPPAAQTCAEPPSRIVMEEWARVVYDIPLNLRPEPGTQLARLDVIPPGELVYIIDGSVCAEGYRWWQVEWNEQTGWIVEGDPANGEYWLEPLGQIETIEDADGVERRYIVDENGDPIERAGCMTPPDDYTRVQWGYATFNRRTVAMLQQAQRIYNETGGPVKFEDMVVQGSYNPGVEASFGTHDAGGAVDISVRSRVDFSVLTIEIMPMLDALRTAGFAAWLRSPDELYPGSAIHIHAVAIGDEEASEAARGQVDGEFGYLLGYNGLPQEEGQPPIPDAYGDPVICQWMRDAGFDDLRDPEMLATVEATPEG